MPQLYPAVLTAAGCLALLAADWPVCRGVLPACVFAAGLRFVGNAFLFTAGSWPCGAPLLRVPNADGLLSCRCPVMLLCRVSLCGLCRLCCGSGRPGLLRVRLFRGLRARCCLFAEGGGIAPHDRGQVGADLLHGPVPPAQLQQPLDGRRIETLADLPGGDAADDGVGRHILRDDRTRRDHSPVADLHARHDDRLVADPDVVADDDVALVVPGRGDILPVESPLFEKEREGVVRQRSQRMVGAVEQEFRPTGDRTEFADHQPVAVDGVVVEDVVAFELHGVVHEIVVDRVVADLDHRVRDDRIQVDRLAVVRAGVGFRIHGSGSQSVFTVMMSSQSVV